MLTAEKINYFATLMANNQVPAPEDSADFEIFKAMQMAGNVAQVQATVANAQATPVAAPAPAPAPAPLPATQLTPVTPAPMPMAMTPSNGSAFTMDDLMSSSMSVDKYLKVKYQQTFIGDDAVNGDMYVVIVKSEVVPKLSIKGGNPVQYRSTIDGKTCLEGGTWMEAVTNVQKLSKDARPYNCADIPMHVAKDVLSFTGNVIASVGDVLGHTTSTTNWRNWREFYNSTPKDQDKVFAKVSRVDRKKNSNQWGLVKFEYIPDDEAAKLGLVG